MSKKVVAEELSIAAGTKAEKYESVLPQIKALVEGEPNLVANLANVASALHMTFGFFWVGFYLVDTQSSNEELVLGPFQGTIACTRIRKGKGVCGVYPREIAETKAVEVNDFARAAEHPLLCDIEVDE